MVLSRGEDRDQGLASGGGAISGFYLRWRDEIMVLDRGGGTRKGFGLGGEERDQGLASARRSEIRVLSRGEERDEGLVSGGVGDEIRPPPGRERIFPRVVVDKGGKEIHRGRGAGI